MLRDSKEIAQSIPTKRPVVILFDDDTFIRLSSGCWNGGSHHLWEEYLFALKKYLHFNNIDIYMGIATSKKSEDPIMHEVKKTLENYLDPDLIFFMKGHCKITFALKPLQEKISVANHDLWIIESNHANAKAAFNQGYAYSSTTKLRDTTNVAHQAYFIRKMFSPIFKKYNVPLPKTKFKNPLTKKVWTGVGIGLGIATVATVTALCLFSSKKSLKPLTADLSNTKNLLPRTL